MSEELLSEMIDMYGNLIFSICLKLTNDYFDAQDLVQDTFMLAYDHYDSFDGNNEKAWLCRIATNRCIDYLRKKTPVTTTNSLEDIELISNGPTPEQTYADKDLRQTLLSICHRLKKPYRQVAIDYFCNEMTVKEMSLTTGKNIKTLQTQVYRARKLLKQMLKEEFGQ